MDLWVKRGFFKDHYKGGKLLGEGANGFAMFASKKGDNEDKVQFVVKCLKKPQGPTRKAYSEILERHVPIEVYVLAQVRHANLPQFVDYFDEPPCAKIVMKWSGSQETSLLEYLDAGSDYLTEEKVRRIFVQLVDAVHYIHDKGIAHRDIKTENILIDEEKHITLIDFGSACLSGKTIERSYIQLGTQCFQSPEIIRGDAIDKQSCFQADSWATGCVLYELLFAERPFETRSAIISGDYNIPYDADASKEVLTLLGRFLEIDRKKRITLSEAARHPWIIGPTTSAAENISTDSS